MSKIFHYFLFLLIFASITKNIKGKSIFWNITLTERHIQLGNSGEAYLTIYLDDVPKNVINFENTIIIGINLKNPDSTFTAQVHHYSSTKDEEIYKIDFTSETIGKNFFIITLYDYENQKSFELDGVEFEIKKKEIIIEEIIPDPSKTKLIKAPKYVGENDTINFEFSLVDTKGNDIIGNNTFLKKLKVLNNENFSKNAKITLVDNGKIFNVTLSPEYLPLKQEINVEFNGQKQKFNVFLENLEVIVVVYPCYLKTNVICENCNYININDSILIDIYLYNFKNIPVNTDDYSDTFVITIDGPYESQYFESKNYSIKKDNKDKNLYKIITLEDDIFIHNGTYKIKVYEDGNLIKEFEIILSAKEFDLNGFILEFIDSNFNPKDAYIDTEFGMVLKGTDFYGNIVPLSLEKDIILKLIDENNIEIKYSKTFDDDKKGLLKIYIISKTFGYAKLKMYYKNKEILTINKNQSLPEFYFNIMKCIKSLLFKDELDTPFVGKNVTFYLQCFDKFGNRVKRGGEDFTSDNYLISEEKYTSFEVKIKDLKTGNYSFSFIPLYEGKYYIRIYLDNKLFIEITYDIGKKHCEGNTPFLCPNKPTCVSKLIDCIEPKNNCPSNYPFLCKVNNSQKCVESQTECDCPNGYKRCNYMKYCVPENRGDMCADYFSQISENTCKKLKQFKFLCDDGICRISRKLSPTQKVCPIGKVLCADLSCRDNYNECAVSDYCEEGEIRCGDQSCVVDYTECPSTISCQDKKYVCPNGKCVDNEVECEGLPTCSVDEPYRCQDNLCVKDKNSCVKNIACGQRMALCEDLICRTTCDNI